MSTTIDLSLFNKKERLKILNDLTLYGKESEYVRTPDQIECFDIVTQDKKKRIYSEREIKDLRIIGGKGKEEKQVLLLPFSYVYHHMSSKIANKEGKSFP